MPLLESEAIILRSRPFGEADKLVVFLTRTHGRLRGVAPSGRKSRRRFGAALEPLSYVRLWFFERAERELVRLHQTDLLDTYWETRGEFLRSVALNQVIELAEVMLPERETTERAFRLLLATLEGFRARRAVWLPLTYYQVWMVRLAGWLPPLERCSRCGRTLDEHPGFADPGRGQLACRRCRQPGMRSLGAASRRAAASILATPLWKLAEEGWDRQRAAELQGFLLDTIECHGERKLVTREMLDENF